MAFEAVIGLEIHVQMKTRSKMFSSSPNGFSHEPNTQVAPFDMAFPGTMPTVNKAAVINAIRVANALHMQIDRLIRFDRKNYFYADLPKGYQITQQFHPIGHEGYLDILDRNGNAKHVGIERIHMEEDTCKQLHFEDYTLLDYNRAGVPLLEIVSRPEIRDGTEAMRFVEAIRRIVVYTLTSDGKMEEGSLRCDVNVSLRPVGSRELGTKVEIKNLNSIRNIGAALDYEIARQSSILLSGGKIQQETRRYDEALGKTVLMRVKTDAVDYKYFPEPNIPPIRISEGFVRDAIETCPELFETKKARYTAAGVSPVDAEIILDDLAMAQYFDEAFGDGKYAKTISNLLIVEVKRYLNREEISVEELNLKPEILHRLAELQEEGFAHKQVADMLNYCIEHPGSKPEDAIKALGITKQSSDDSLVLCFVTDVLDANLQSIVDYKAGKDRAMGYLVGQVMKAAKGKLNPSAVAKVMAEELRKR